MLFVFFFPSIFQRTIRAAVEQHFFDLQTKSVDRSLSNYDSQGWVQTHTLSNADMYEPKEQPKSISWPKERRITLFSVQG